MKSFIILVLLVALGAAAFFTRPTPDDFRTLVVQKATSADTNLFARSFDQTRARTFADQCTFNDRLLWVTVQKDGKTLYTGAFSHWFDNGAIADEAHRFEADAQRK